MTAHDTQVAPALPAPAARPKPRLVPPLVLVAAYWTGWLVVNIFYAATFTQFLYLFWSPIALVLAMLVWWLAFSRLAWLDRLWGVCCLVIGGALATALADKSLATPPVPMGLLMYGLPAALTAMMVWLVITRGASSWPVRAGLVAASLLSWGYFTLLRVDGIDGNLTATRSWRWVPTAEDRFLLELTQVSSQPPREAAPPRPMPGEASGADWPEFRGALRDGAVRGVRFSADWKAHPPREIWRRRVGPGWSSVATVGDYGFTQEQRGEDEAVVCFELQTGREVWSHTDRARFWEVVAGAGPRATPTFHAGKLYTQGASGKLNCLDAKTGNVIWTRDILDESSSDPQARPPQWGFSASPLITGGVVIAFAGGQDDKALLAAACHARRRAPGADCQRLRHRVVRSGQRHAPLGAPLEARRNLSRLPAARAARSAGPRGNRHDARHSPGED
jgi:hypothetical protein